MRIKQRMGLALGTMALACLTAAVASAQDRDSDGVPDASDNCVDVPNGPTIPDAGGYSQRDSDGDGVGNVCDADLDGNGFVDQNDLDLMKLAFYGTDPDPDLNGDGLVDPLDLGVLSTLFERPPGPSCCRVGRTVITEVVVTDDGRSSFPGYHAIQAHTNTDPDTFDAPSDVNAGIGGETVAVWVKYEDVLPNATTPVLTSLSVENWPNWNTYCPAGFQPAVGNQPPGALTTGTSGSCNRMGLCVRMEPMQDATEHREEAPPLVSAGLSWSGAGDAYTCPTSAPLASDAGLRWFASRDIHEGCGDGTWARLCGYASRGHERPRMETYITEVRVADTETAVVPGYTPLSYDLSAVPGRHTTPSDVNQGIGGGTVSLWAKFEEVDPSSTTPVLTALSVENWPAWNPYCPPGYQQAPGNSPSGALTTGTIGTCNRMGLCVKLEPVDQVEADPNTFPVTTLGLSLTSSGGYASCPAESDPRWWQDPRSSISDDIHQGCGGDWVRVCEYAEAPPELPPGPAPTNLHALAEQYAPRWRFYPGEWQYPMDLSTHLTEPVQLSEGVHSQEYGVSRVCQDPEGWRLSYDWTNPIPDDDQIGREFGTPGGGTAYAFVGETETGYDIHYFVYYVYNIAHPLVTAYDHWGDWERATVHLEWVDGSLDPTGLTTEAHGNTWYNAWSSGEVWNEDPDDPGAGPTDHPHVFVAEGSHGTYPNAGHEHGLLECPGINDQNRTCVDAHKSLGQPCYACDFIDGSTGGGASDPYAAILPVETIRVDHLVNPLDATFHAIDTAGVELANQPEWLSTDFACSGSGPLVGPIYWWGNDTHDGGPRTLLVKGNMPWSNPYFLNPPGNALWFTLDDESAAIDELAVVPSQTYIVEFKSKFADVTEGGAIDLVFDPALLSVDSITLDNDGSYPLGDEPDYRCPATNPASPVECTGDSLRISFASAPGILDGKHAIARIELQGVGTGTSEIDYEIVHPFADVFGDPIDVPEPRFGLLAGGVLLALLSRSGRRRRNRSLR